MRTLEGHVKAVGSVNWSRNNRYLVSSSLDSTVIIWDLSVLNHPELNPQIPIQSASTARVQALRFDAPVASAEFHPRNSRIVLATLTCNEVMLVDLRVGGGKVVLEDTVEGDDMIVDGEGEGVAEKEK